jgi:RimJ/RimL family protein N-acetyltransferase
MSEHAPAQPVGRPVDAAPAPWPEPVTLVGRFGRLEKLDAARHGAALWDALRGHDWLWTYMFYGPFADEGGFRAWLAERESLQDPFYFAVVDRADRPLGLAALMSVRPDMRVIEIGHILLSPALQRSALATEAQYLVARHVFETLRYRRYEWKCDALNAASRAAAARLGFTFEGVFRRHMIVKGRNRDTAWYAMLDTEWPARRRAFERWLAPDNFDAAGRQKLTLSECLSNPDSA